MSLINDALKRAKEAQQQNQPASSGPPLRPAEPVQPQAGSGTKTLIYILVACVVFGNALLFLALGLKKESPKTSQPPSVAAVTPAATPPPAITATTAATPIVPPPAPQPVAIVATNAELPSASLAGTNSPPATNLVAGVAVEPEPPKVAPLKLQSIIYSSRPSAMISGKFLFIGDKIRGFRVAAIDQESVTLVGNNETNVMSLP